MPDGATERGKGTKVLDSSGKTLALTLVPCKAVDHYTRYTKHGLSQVYEAYY